MPAQHEPLRAALVVVSYRAAALLAQNLAATAAELKAGHPVGHGAELAVDVVVVDNSPGADERAATRALGARHGWLVVESANEGFGAGVNLAARHATERGAEVLLVVNPDLALPGPAARALVEHVRQDPGSLVAPAIARPDGSPWSTGGTLDVRRGRTRQTNGPADDVDWLSGACFAVATAAWQRLGGFDERMFLYWEDVDLSWRARAEGLRLVVRHDLSAVHDVGGTQEHAGTRRRSDVYYEQNCRNRLVFAAHHLGAVDRLRWAAGAPSWARAVVLRGGRRQLVQSPGPLLAVARGTLSGLRYATRRRPPWSGSARTRRLVVAHPSTELYGADQQMLESLTAAVEGGWEVTLVLPGTGPLTKRAAARGARVLVLPFPVLRKSLLTPRGALGFGVSAVRDTWRTARWLRRNADALYVSTVTIPTWLAAARLARVPALCHVHEAEADQPRVVTAVLTAPLLAARRLVANSAAARDALSEVFGRLAARTRVVHNGVQGPPQEPTPAAPAPGAPLRLVLVGRLSPRKGTDVAVEAVGILVAEGRDVHLRVAGSVFTGYEWFEQELRARVDALGLVDRVELLGFVHPTWPELSAADVVLVPSRVEPFGNTAVEAMLAHRPVVASRAQGLAEVVRDGETGLLVVPGDPQALADAIRRLHDDAPLRATLAAAGRADALERFGTARYADDVRAELAALVQEPVRRAG